MNGIISIIKEFEGILGTILGSTTTLIVSDILRKKGKLKTYLVEWEGNYETYGDVGCYMNGKEDSDFYSYSIYYTLHIYNGSDIPKIMRNFKIKFYKGKKERFSLIPNDESTRRLSNSGSFVDKIEIININPKEIQVLKQSGYIHIEELESIEESSKIELSYSDEKDKVRSITLFKGSINKSNYIPRH